MTFSSRLALGVTAGMLFATLFALPQVLPAQEHIVSSTDLQKDVAKAAQLRQERIGKIDKFLSTDQARTALKTANVDYDVVRNGVSTLSDDELARLSARADQAQKDFAAGALTNEQITYIIIALAAAVIVLIAVH
ncbi:MAG TPA: hypothetical protein VJN69_10525 [Candidatus Acidoferrales bacterium]|nr:hypothetical protein [Candidatus Acidoferrales bacterium]